MICPKCKTENLDNANFCVGCGASLAEAKQAQGNPKESGSNHLSLIAIIGICIPIVLILVGLGLGVYYKTKKIAKNISQTVESVADGVSENVQEEPKDGRKESEETIKKVIEDAVEKIEDVSVPDSYKHTKLLTEENDESDVAGIKPSVEKYTIDEDFGNVINSEDFKWRDKEFMDMLRENGFVVQDGNGREFYEGYEMNRYLQIPSFVTVDSMMHTYHVYFAYLLRSVEKNYLCDEFESLINDMLLASYDQYQNLVGTEFEEAAKRNTAFFAVADVLLNPEAKFPGEVSDVVKHEYDLIMAAEGIDVSRITDDYEDYSQYKPRGYYEGDEELEKYFRAMMWCGRIQFTQKDEDMDRSALLMALALDNGLYDEWNSIYTVTSFFAGASDDLGYCEYMPLINSVYGEGADLNDIAGDEEGWKKFHNASAKLEAPRINSIVLDDAKDQDNVILGYRFMGQRFSVDATIMQELVYSRVGDYEDEDKRLLPDVLDVPAALGSDEAYKILDDAGVTSYKNYTKNINALREEFDNDDSDIWSASLYAGWINTLRPLLEEKGEGYPMFMQNKLWTRKTLETFAGSYTELKHDTILYSKQMMAEMGGGDEEKDFRGYVEPEPLVYSRFANLAENTSKGLERYGYLTKEDKENLSKLSELANKLKVISIKELTEESLTDEEFELIECYGGEIEHFWFDAMKGITGEEYPTTEKFPAALVVDIATDPNGSVLEAATGNPASIYVVVPVDGKLRIAEGSVYSFYEFEQPLSDRLTDSDWRKILGIEIESYDNPFPETQEVEHPDWVNGYRYIPHYDY